MKQEEVIRLPRGARRASGLAPSPAPVRARAQHAAPRDVTRRGVSVRQKCVSRRHAAPAGAAPAAVSARTRGSAGAAYINKNKNITHVLGGRGDEVLQLTGVGWCNEVVT